MVTQVANVCLTSCTTHLPNLQTTHTRTQRCNTYTHFEAGHTGGHRRRAKRRDWQRCRSPPMGWRSSRCFHPRGGSNRLRLQESTACAEWVEGRAHDQVQARQGKATRGQFYITHPSRQYAHRRECRTSAEPTDLYERLLTMQALSTHCTHNSRRHHGCYIRP